jgi:hypothetical protein
MSTIGALQLDHPLRRCGALAAIRSPRRRHWALAGLGMTLGLGACGGGGGSSTQEMDLIAVSNGFGLLLPHQVLRLDGTGAPTTELVAIRSYADLLDNVTLANPVRPVTQWPGAAVLPDGTAGNHYLYAEFSASIDVTSVLSSDPDLQAGAGLNGGIAVQAGDPATGERVAISGRAFVGGRTYAGTAAGSPAQLPLVQWVALDESSGLPVAVEIEGQFPGLGFPGTEGASSVGAATLLSERTLVFVVDGDGDLRTHETFPAGHQIELRAGAGVRSSQQEQLLHVALASATVGPDSLPPEVALTPPPQSVPFVEPPYGAIDVDPATAVTLHFSEPVQPLSVGALPTGPPPPLSSAVQLRFGPATLQTSVPFTALPASPYDFSTWVLTPVFAFPGSGPSFAQCGTFSTISIDVAPAQVRDLADLPPPNAGGNTNGLPAASHFTTGEGPGLVNAPVAPDVIYALRQGALASVSVIDLNGFGQSTGDPTFDFTYSSFPAGNSNFPNNPNLKLQGATLSPPLSPGTCTVDGGSSGVFSLTRDSSLDDRLLRGPLIETAADLMIGQPLDLVFHNGKDSGGCQAGGGNVCAINGFKVNDGGNPVQFAPHPNPPPLRFPPLCVQPYIGGAEPTSVVSPGGNFLFPGDPFGKPDLGIPPSGLLSSGGNTGFLGPDSPATPLNACAKYVERQQIGHFLYLIDRARREVVVLNSNRFTVLDRITLPDPTDLAMGPNLDFLAVSSQKANSVAFIDIDPNSSSFHKVIKTTQVGAGPRGIAWDPGNEALIVCCEGDGTAMVLSAFDFNVRKVLKNALTKPFDVAITQRQLGFGTNRNVWFGWILNRNGELAIYESGPSGINGWGFDDVIGIAQSKFEQPQRVAVDVLDLRGAVWIAHQNALAPDGSPSGLQGGAISNMVIESSSAGILILGAAFGNPAFRQMNVKLLGSLGSDILTGVPTDIALDDMINVSLLVNLKPPQGAGVPKATNGKALVRGEVLNNFATGFAIRAKTPEFLFLAIPDSSEGAGAVDVIQLGSSLTRFDVDPYQSGTQSVPVSGVRHLCDYWRQ